MEELETETEFEEETETELLPLELAQAQVMFTKQNQPLKRNASEIKFLQVPPFKAPAFKAEFDKLKYVARHR